MYLFLKIKHSEKCCDVHSKAGNCANLFDKLRLQLFYDILCHMISFITVSSNKASSEAALKGGEKNGTVAPAFPVSCAIGRIIYPVVCFLFPIVACSTVSTCWTSFWLGFISSSYKTHHFLDPPQILFTSFMSSHPPVRQPGMLPLGMLGLLLLSLLPCGEWKQCSEAV